MPPHSLFFLLPCVLSVATKSPPTQQPPPSAYSLGLENLSDLMMGFVMMVSIAGLLLIFYKIYKTGSLKTQVAASLGFQIVLIINQSLGIWGRITPATSTAGGTGFTLGLAVAITCLTLLLSLWNRMYVVRMIELLLSRFKKWAAWLYLGNLLYFTVTAAPLFAWFYIKGDTEQRLSLWMVVGLPLWVLSIVVFETGSMLIVGALLYKKTTRINWHNTGHIQSTKRKFVHMLGLLLLVVALDVFGLISLGFAYFGPKVDQFSWARVSLYTLPLHFFCASIYFSQAADLGFATPSISRSSSTASTKGKGAAVNAHNKRISGVHSRVSIKGQSTPKRASMQQVAVAPLMSGARDIPSFSGQTLYDHGKAANNRNSIQKDMEIEVVL